MTQEEKARAYDEALERARKIHDQILNNELIGFPDQIREIFPQLRESEDEKIRKEMIGMINECTNWAHKKEYVKYLEKQKESQELPLMNGDADLYFDTWRQEVPVPTFRQCFEEGMRYVQRLQKEQKSVHTAKEMWKEMRLEVYAQASGNRHEPNYSDDSTKMFSLCDIDEIFEKIGNSTVEPQPAEWSWEDEKIAYTILNLLCSQVTYVTGQGTTSGKQFPTYAKERDWFEKRFKSLRPQYHEDVTMTEVYKMGKEAGEASHWKPTEGQMEALNSLLCQGDFSYIGQAQTLQSLYIDLMKL